MRLFKSIAVGILAAFWLVFVMAGTILILKHLSGSPVALISGLVGFLLLVVIFSGIAWEAWFAPKEEG